MKIFEIQYINRYYEEKEYYNEFINAKSEEEALKKFAKIFGIKNYHSLSNPFFIWENDYKLSNIKLIREVK